MTLSTASGRKWGPAHPVLLVIAVLLVIGIDASGRFAASTSMEHFLPGQGERKLYRVSRQVIDSTLTGRMVFTVGLRDAELSRDERRDKLRAATSHLIKQLDSQPGFGTLTSGPPEGLEETFFKLYFPRRFAYFSLNPEDDAQRLLSPQGLEERARQLKEQLGGPQGVFIRQLAPRDPWLLFIDFLGLAEKSAVRLDIHDGQFFARPGGSGETGASTNEDFAIVFAELKDSALDSTAQGPVLEGLRGAISATRGKHGESLIVEASGANRFAVATEASMKSDIQRVFSFSTVGLLALFFIFFRSLRRVLFLLLPIGAGLVTALWVSLLAFGQIHALTLAFGGALIGIAIDYPVHVLCHHDLGGAKRSVKESARALLPTLALAAGTTIVGLVGLAWAGFPGIQEIAVFSCVGVSAALVTTLLTTNLIPATGEGTRAAIRFAGWLSRALESLRAHRTLLWALLGVTFLLGATGLSLVNFAPGLESLAPLDRDLLAEDARVQGRIGEVDGGKLAIALAPSLEDALQINEEVARRLERAKSDGLLKDFTSVVTLLRSNSLQTASAKSISAAPGLAAKTLKALEGEGFVAAGFPDLEEELQNTPPPLTLEQLEKTPLSPLVAPLVFKTGVDFAVITPLSGIENENAIATRIESVDGAHFFSQRALLNQAYGDLRERTTELLLLGLLFVFLAAVIRYRNFRKALAALLPSVLASGATIGLLAFGGVEINLLHLLGLLLVCCMGVDYGVFLVDSKPGHTGPALLSITVGCLSTMMSFGALALSRAPALTALGSSIGIGIVLSFLIAPTAFLLLHPEPTDASHD